MKRDQIGWIEVICGGMFSGKTEELIRRLRRSKIAKLNVYLFKPARDTRYHVTNVVSHAGTEMSAKVVTGSQEIPGLCGEADVIGVDEAQFFDDALPEVLQTLADQGLRIVVAGLELDSNRKPFGPMPTLLCLAERITKLQAVCVVCGYDAAFSKRTVADTNTVCVGGPDKYEARCRNCY